MLVLLGCLFSISLVYIFVGKQWVPEFDKEVSYLRRQVDHLNHTALVSETDTEGNITYVNEKFCEVSQYSREELLGNSHKILNSGYRDEKFWEHYWQVISSGKVWRGEIRNKAKDGSYYWVFATVSAITDEQNNIIGYKAVRVNITQLKEAEAREIQRRERLVEFNEAIVKLHRHESFITHDYSELLLHITKTVSSILDISRVSIWTFGHDQEGAFIHLSNLWDQSETRYYRNLVLHSKDYPAYFKALAQDRMLIYDDVYHEPDLIDFQASYFPENNIKSMFDTPFYESGQLAGVICVEQTDNKRQWQLEEQSFLLSISDILTIVFESSKRFETEQNLRHSEKLEALGNLTSGIAHDFNNMLGVIMGYSEILMAKLQDDEVLTKYAHQIHEASLRGAKLTANLLSFSRKKKLQKETFSLSQFVADNFEMVQQTLTVKVSVTKECEETDWQVYIDKSDLEHALLNLCINSMHAMKTVETPEVRIVTFNRQVSDLLATKLGINAGDYCVLSIADNGCGIEPHVLSRVQDPFYTTKGDKGSGLGLAQVTAFMKRAKGALHIESTLGLGTIVSLYIPKAELESGLLVAENDDKAFVSRANNEHILIVDDEDEICQMAAEILSEYGYKTHTVQSAVDALTYLQTNSIDLILTDVVMPQMDGYLFTSKVTKLYPEIKIQLMTGFAENQDNSLISKDLLDQVLLKPFEPIDLVRQIDSVLNDT